MTTPTRTVVLETEQDVRDMLRFATEESTSPIMARHRCHHRRGSTTSTQSPTSFRTSTSTSTRTKPTFPTRKTGGGGDHHKNHRTLPLVPNLSSRQVTDTATEPLNPTKTTTTTTRPRILPTTTTSTSTTSSRRPARVVTTDKESIFHDNNNDDDTFRARNHLHARTGTTFLETSRGSPHAVQDSQEQVDVHRPPRPEQPHIQPQHRVVTVHPDDHDMLYDDRFITNTNTTLLPSRTTTSSSSATNTTSWKRGSHMEEEDLDTTTTTGTRATPPTTPRPMQSPFPFSLWSTRSSATSTRAKNNNHNNDQDNYNPPPPGPATDYYYYWKQQYDILRQAFQRQTQRLERLQHENNVLQQQRQKRGKGGPIQNQDQKHEAHPRDNHEYTKSPFHARGRRDDVDDDTRSSSFHASAGARFVSELSQVMDLAVGDHADLAAIMDRVYYRQHDLRDDEQGRDCLYTT